MVTEKEINTLEQLLEEGRRVEQTREKGGLYDVVEVVDRSLFLAWRSKVLAYMRNLKLDIPDIIGCIEGQTKEYFSNYKMIKECIIM